MNTTLHQPEEKDNYEDWMEQEAGKQTKEQENLGEALKKLAKALNDYADSHQKLTEHIEKQLEDLKKTIKKSKKL